MPPITRQGRILAVMILAFAASASGADQPNKSSDKDQKKDSKSSSTDDKRSAAPARDSGPARNAGPSSSGPANRTTPNYVPNHNVPNAAAAPSDRRLLGPTGGSSGNDSQSQWQRDQWERERELDRERDRDERDRDQRDRSRQIDNRDAASSNFIPNTNNLFRGSGPLVAVRPGQLVINANGNLLRVQPTADSIVEVVGTADPHALQPGRVVRVQGLFETHGSNRLQAAGPLTDVEIITPRAGEVPGTITPLPLDAAQINLANQAPGANPIRSLAVIGRIQKYANGELTLDLAGKNLKAALDPAATIHLNSTNVSQAHPGDHVDVAGYYLQPGVAVGNVVKITLTNSFGKPQGNTVKQKPVSAAVPAPEPPAGD